MASFSLVFCLPDNSAEMQGVMVNFGAAKWIAKAMTAYSESCDVLVRVLAVLRRACVVV